MAVFLSDSIQEKRDGSEFAKECVRVNGIMFKDLADYLRHGREIEFAVKGRAYSITNHSGKWHLCDDIIMKRYRQFGFAIMDETYGYNMTKYTGYLLSNRQHCECIIEIYHEGDMVFVSEE